MSLLQKSFLDINHVYNTTAIQNTQPSSCWTHYTLMNQQYMCMYIRSDLNEKVEISAVFIQHLLTSFDKMKGWNLKCLWYDIINFPFGHFWVEFQSLKCVKQNQEITSSSWSCKSEMEKNIII